MEAFSPINTGKEREEFRGVWAPSKAARKMNEESREEERKTLEGEGDAGGLAPAGWPKG